MADVKERCSDLWVRTQSVLWLVLGMLKEAENQSFACPLLLGDADRRCFLLFGKEVWKMNLELQDYRTKYKIMDLDSEIIKN